MSSQEGSSVGLQLVIGNRVYSSWSLRPWILLKAFDIPFTEDLILLDTEEFKPRVRAYNAGNTVPILVDKERDITVWESLAICDYVSDIFVDKAVWPRDLKARAFARVVANEMHSGFRALRSNCPMNLRKQYAYKENRGGEEVAKDVSRIVSLWTKALVEFGKPSGQGPFLFGAFTAADAMFAPVVTRLHGYSFRIDEPLVRAYMDAVLTMPSFAEWASEAAKEEWVVDNDEVEEEAIGPFLIPSV